MTTQVQFLTTPEGHRLAVLPVEEYDRLRALAEGRDDELTPAETARLDAIQGRIDAGEGTIPAAVVNLMLDEGCSAVKAWRKYRGMSQVDLARATGLSQPFIGKIENGEVYGTRGTRQKLAQALDAPIWALDDQS